MKEEEKLTGACTIAQLVAYSNCSKCMSVKFFLYYIPNDVNENIQNMP